MRPSRARVAGTGLAFAALTILALALMARFELDREGALHREVITGLAVKDSLETLRVRLADLRHSARVATLSGDPEAVQEIERRAVEIDAELGYLAQHPSLDDPGQRFASLADAARLLVVNARTAAAPGRGSDDPAWREVERLGAEASTALERMLEWQSSRINERTLAQIRIGEALRAYVTWLLAGSIAVLVGLFGFYRWAKVREERTAARIEHLAHHDTVTGLPNRALLNDRLDQALARAYRSAEPFALVAFDLDGFKAINDMRGHATGDRALELVAARARECMRASDTLGRLGGDEFLAILPDTGLEGALTVAEKLRAALAQPYDFGAFRLDMSASIGVSVFPTHGQDGDALQSAADAALYDAKRSGKNRVCVAAASRPGRAAATADAREAG